MKHSRALLCCGVLFVVIGVGVGCSSGPSEEELALQAMQAANAEIQQEYESLLAARQELVTMKETVADLEAIAERQRTDEQKQQLEEVTAKLEPQQALIDQSYQALQDKLAAFLNDALNNHPEAPETAEGLAVYANEAIVNAEDIIAKSGDYKKAIETMMGAKNYYEAIGLTPIAVLDEKIDYYQNRRYITQERFDQLAKNMTPEEVTEIAGVPYYLNIKQDEKRKIETWLYPRREGGAASVTFNRKGRVYHLNFDAVKPQVVGE